MTLSHGRGIGRPTGVWILLLGDIIFVLPYLVGAVNVMAHPEGSWNGLSRLAAPNVAALIALFYLVIVGAWFRNSPCRHLTIVILGIFTVLNIWQSVAIVFEVMALGNDIAKAFEVHFWRISLGLFWCLWLTIHIWYFYVRPGDDFYGRTVGIRTGND